MRDRIPFAFTDRGRHLAAKVSDRLSCECNVDLLITKAAPKDYLREHFDQKDTFIFICAAGIAVRMIAPLIKSKDVDPAVIVMDEFWTICDSHFIWASGRGPMRRGREYLLC